MTPSFENAEITCICVVRYANLGINKGNKVGLHEQAVPSES
jgi:hypothetical protein